MNEVEAKFFNEEELKLYDATSLPPGYLLKSLLLKLRRRLWGRFTDKSSRMIWTLDSVSDASGPAANVRNYLEANTLRCMLREVTKHYQINSACEVGCGYGRLTMVLKEFAGKVVGFERERHLLEAGRALLPSIEFREVNTLTDISSRKGEHFDLVMICTVLQHLTDDFCKAVIDEIKKICPKGHVIIIEKTEAIAVTENTENGDSFLSRARSVEAYEGMMRPFNLISVQDRMLEPGYHNPRPGKCMLFRSDKI
jgi:protein-L-isoaspartate O-methyltransferase